MESLKLDKELTKSTVAGAKRLASVEEAIGWPSGLDQDHKIGTVVFEKGIYKVRLSKPGKEAATEYDKCKHKDGHKSNNPNDMRPEIFRDGRRIEKNATFRDVFVEIEIIKNANKAGLELFGCLLCRSAFMADHVEVEPGIWRYQPAIEQMVKLAEYIPEIYGVPAEVFMHYLNALALNEDTKYHTLGYNIKTDTGRRNNLLTCVNLTGVFLDKVSIVDFAGSFSRPPAGISAMAISKIWEVFPELT